MNKRTVCARRLCAYVFKHVSTDFANQFEPEWYVPLTAYCRIIFHKCSHVLSLSSSYKWYQVSAVQKKDCSLFAISMNSSEEKFRTQGLCCVLCAISSSPSPPPPPLAHRPMCLCVCVNALKHAYKIDFQTNIRNDFWSKNEQNWNGNENARTSNDFRQGNWRKNIQIVILCFVKWCASIFIMTAAGGAVVITHVALNEREHGRAWYFYLRCALFTYQDWKSLHKYYIICAQCVY